MIVFCDIDDTLFNTTQAAIELAKLNMFEFENYIEDPNSPYPLAFPPTKKDLDLLIKQSENYPNTSLIQELKEYDRIDFITSRGIDFYNVTVKQLQKHGFMRDSSGDMVDFLHCCNSEDNKCKFIAYVSESNPEEQIIVYDDNPSVIRFLDMIRNKYENIDVVKVELPVTI